MKPIRCRRRSERAGSDIAQTRSPAIRISPSLGRVSVPIMASSVDLPEPERPTIEMDFACCDGKIGAINSVDARLPIDIGFSQANGAQDHGALSIWIMR